MDGEPRPLGFLRGDDLNEVARRWVAAHSIVGEDAVRTLVERMRAKIREAPALDGEALGCPALEDDMESPLKSLTAFTQRAVHIAGPDGRIIVTMATGGYAALMAAKLPVIRRVEPLLTLEGLRLAGLARRPAWWRT